MMQPVAGPLALTPDQLRRTVDTASLPFETTADVAPLRGEKPDDYAYPDLGDLIFGEGDND